MGQKKSYSDQCITSIMQFRINNSSVTFPSYYCISFFHLFNHIHFSASVGEVNVVEEMKKRDAVIGGEGNGGVIYPELHYGRDALVGIALFLSHLAKSKRKSSALRKLYPHYVIAKKKLKLDPAVEFDKIIATVKSHFKGHLTDERDGLWIENKNGWVQIRKSNTEPIMRIYAEGRTSLEADDMADTVIRIVKGT